VDFRIVDELPFGFGWLIRERYGRTSHALAADGRVWLVDPVEVGGLDGRIGALGEPAGVVQLLDRHGRDCAAIAGRLGVPHHVVPETLPGTPFEVRRVVRIPRWHEVALWWPDRRTLVCADVLGTLGFFTAGGGAVGLHPFLRLRPPSALRGLDPEHVLVGHGRGVHEGAADAVHEALRSSRRGLPRWAAGLARAIARGDVR
jgi:hypothetical protein